MNEIFWLAAGSIGTLILAVIAYAQLKQNRGISPSSEEPPKAAKVAVLVISGGGAFPISDGLKAAQNNLLEFPIYKDVYALSNVNFSFVFIKNKSGRILSDVSLEMPVSELVDMRVSNTDSIGKSAISFDYSREDTLVVSIDSMPEGETIALSLLGNGSLGVVKSRSANFEIEHCWGGPNL